jgi:HSP20 family protein
MNVVRWSPFKELDNLFQGLERPSASVRRADWLPLVDIRESEGAYEIDVEVPAVASEDLSVSVADGVLTVSGERKVGRGDENSRLHRVERCYGKFLRTFQLPDDADHDSIEASSHDGVLYLRIAKRESAQSRPIEIKRA